GFAPGAFDFDLSLIVPRSFRSSFPMGGLRLAAPFITPPHPSNLQIPGANLNSHPAIPQHPSHLQVIIDIRYQYAIIMPLSRHASPACPPEFWRRRVPCEPCASAARSF